MPSTTMMSPLGELVLVADDDGLAEVRLPAPESPLPQAAAAGGAFEWAVAAGGPGWAPDPAGAPGWAEGGPVGAPSPPLPGARRSTHAILAAARQQLAEYFAGRRCAFELPLKVTGTEFERSVWEALGTVAYGETVTYGRLACAIGRPRAARAVGAALGRNRLAIVVPCHRVVAAGGRLGGFAGGLARKRFLLACESLEPRGGAVGVLSASRVR